MVATPEPIRSAIDQVTPLGISCVLPSVKVPIALNACDVPLAIDGLLGLTASPVSAAAVTSAVVVAVFVR